MKRNRVLSILLLLVAAVFVNGMVSVTSAESKQTRSTTLTEVCATNGIDPSLCAPANGAPFISGIVYTSDGAGWFPLEDMIVFAVSDVFGVIDATPTWADGWYEVWGIPDEVVDLIACGEDFGVPVGGILENVLPPDENADIFVSAEAAFLCDALIDDPPAQNDPADLTIGDLIVAPVNEFMIEVTFTVANTSLIDVDAQFYVDIFATAVADGEPILDDYISSFSIYGLLAEESATFNGFAFVPYPVGHDLIVTAFVDGSDVVPETDEDNNITYTIVEGNAAIHTLSLFLLAYDNPTFSAGNLAPQLPETLEGIVAATENDPGKLAIILADLDSDGDTHIIIAHNGDTEYIDGLPNLAGTLDDNIHEYDMGDGATLGGFLRWARDEFPAPNNTLMVYGHGAPLVPETNLDNLFPIDESTTTSVSRDPIPLPSWVTANPDFTDMHPISILTPHDIALALDIGTYGGFEPFNLVDLVHCFSLSIEETWEIAPYTDVVSGSPGYAYFDAILPGAALDALDATMDSYTMADAVLYTYDSLLPAEGYPRIMTAIDTYSLDSAKILWDDTSAALMRAFNEDPGGTRALLSRAYFDAAKYDTTYCEPDWQMTAPDALVDLDDFALALSNRFPFDSEVSLFAEITSSVLRDAVVARYVTEGTPYFAGADAPHWTFDGLGVSLYADLAGTPDNGNIRLSYISDFYNDTVTAENPHPYRFISESENGTTWADVFNRFWDGVPTVAEACLTTFPPTLDDGELSITGLVSPSPGEARTGSDLLPGIVLSADRELGNAIIHYEIEQNASVVYSRTVPTGRLFAGQHWVTAPDAWVPETAGNYTVRITVDPDNYIIETNEADNVFVFTDEVLTGAAPALQPLTTLANGSQWVTDLSAPLQVDVRRAGGGAVDSVDVTTYNYVNIDSGVGIPTLVDTHNYAAGSNLIDVPLDSSITAGPVQLHIWTNDVVGRSRLPSDLRVNYVPANAPIANAETVCYPFYVEIDDHIQIQLNVPNQTDANFFVWYPTNYDAPNIVATRPGDDDVLIESAPLTGEYLLCIRGETASGTTYTLSVVENHSEEFVHPTHYENDPSAFVPTNRYFLENPAPQSPDLIPTAITLTTSATTAAHTPILLFAAALLTFPILTRRRKI